LTQTALGKVKVDLANFDVKFWTIPDLKKYLFLQEYLPDLFELLI
jgi:hypothetical protein